MALSTAIAVPTPVRSVLNARSGRGLRVSG